MRGTEDAPVTEQADRQHLYSSGKGVDHSKRAFKQLGFTKFDQFQVRSILYSSRSKFLVIST